MRKVDTASYFVSTIELRRDSGRGDITATGDVVGLARGLLAAGVRRVVVSLWPSMTGLGA